jgi:hypothetical protein
MITRNLSPTRRNAVLSAELLKMDYSSHLSKYIPSLLEKGNY